MTKKAESSGVILHEIASLTSIRDIEVFEISFLKSIAEMLKAEEICIYKFNNIQGSCRLLQYSPETEQTENNDKIIQSKDIQVANIDIPQEIKQAKDWIESTDSVYTTQHDGLFYMVYPIDGLKGIVGYLSLNLYKQLTESENMIIASLLSISNNFHSLLEENQKDKLTGLLNRKTFDENVSKIQDILNSANEVKLYPGIEKREHSNVTEYWLAILDIDHFKRVNDTFGHVYGDEVLLLLSQVMKQTFRTKDLLFRFGGEEFIAIVEVTNQQIAKDVFERFRIAIEEFHFPQVGQVTVSIGATQILEQHAISSDIVGRADQALYYAKENGRNKLFVYEELITKGVLEELVEEGDIELF